jgi:hypothetical protein
MKWWEEAVVVFIKMFYWQLSGRSEETHGTSASSLTDFN